MVKRHSPAKVVVANDEEGYLTRTSWKVLEKLTKGCAVVEVRSTVVKKPSKQLGTN
jgi:hypothetical protein